MSPRPKRAGCVLLILLLAAAIGVVAGWSWVDAQARAVVALSAVLEPPVVGPTVEVVTGEPRFEDRRVAGVPTLVVRPEGEGPHPALVFVTGSTPPGNRQPIVRSFAGGLARAGYVVYAPDVPGLRSGELSGRTVSATAQVARAVTRSPGTLDGRVGMVGVSVGGSLALLAAADPALDGRVSVVAVVAPYGDLKTILSLATTGGYERDGRFTRYRTPNYLRLITARSLVGLLPPGEDRAVLMAEIPEIRAYYPAGSVPGDPLETLDEIQQEELGPEAGSVLRLLRNEDPERFGRLYGQLPPEIRAKVRRLSPVNAMSEIEAPVKISSAPRDKYFPLSEQKRLARASSDVRLTVTRSLHHAEPAPSLDELPDLARLDAFVVRSLHEAH
jgi:pimeloyl-ACP methyl ester carboxylesterase